MQLYEYRTVYSNSCYRRQVIVLDFRSFPAFFGFYSAYALTHGHEGALGTYRLRA